jgi:hypothetical protein
MPRTLGTLLTMTTYGTWLRGDERGWVDEGNVWPPDPKLEAADRRRMKHPLYLFPGERLLDVGQMICTSLVDRMKLVVLAATVQTWHAHVVIVATQHFIGEVAKCAKDAARYGLRIDQPIWTDRYDKRYCFDFASLKNRVRYVERHNEALGWPPRPWPQIMDLDTYFTYF